MGAEALDLFTDVGFALRESSQFPRKILRHDVKVPEGEFFPGVRDWGWEVELD